MMWDPEDEPCPKCEALADEKNPKAPISQCGGCGKNFRGWGWCSECLEHEHCDEHVAHQHENNLEEQD
jgi:ribosomal protein L37AE/L43A